MAVRSLQHTLAVAALALGVVLGSAFLWIGIPVLGLWSAGQLTSSSQGFLFAILGGIPPAMVGFGWLLYRLNGVYESMLGGDRPGGGRSPWLVSLSDERAKARRARQPRRLIDVAMTASAGIAMVLMLVWFFFFASSPLAPMQ